MPFIGVGLSTLIAICFVVHALKTGQDRYWIFILFIFPYLGSIVYFIVIVLPSMRYTRTGYQFESKFRKALNPHRELKEAQNAFEVSPTVDSRVRLAKALVDSDRIKDAIPYYEEALTGVYKTAPDILLQYAFALFKNNQYLEAREQLDYLRATNQNYRSDEGHLLYARILVALNDKAAAQEEFDALINYYPSLEALSQYLETLIMWQDFDEARKQLQDFKIRLKHMPKHSRQLNAKWIKEIQNLEKTLN